MSRSWRRCPALRSSSLSPDGTGLLVARMWWTMAREGAGRYPVSCAPPNESGLPRMMVRFFWAFLGSFVVPVVFLTRLRTQWRKSSGNMVLMRANACARIVCLQASPTTAFSSRSRIRRYSSEGFKVSTSQAASCCAVICSACTRLAFSNSSRDLFF